MSYRIMGIIPGVTVNLLFIRACDTLEEAETTVHLLRCASLMHTINFGTTPVEYTIKEEPDD